MLVWLCTLAFAQEDVDDGEDIDISNQDQTKASGALFETKATQLTETLDDDEVMSDFVAESKKKAPPPVWYHVDPAGKQPLADNYDIAFTAVSPTHVVVELPVLVSFTRATFTNDHPNGIELVAEITSGTTKLVQRQQIRAESLLELAPTVSFFKAAIPTAAPAPEVRYVVKVIELPPAAAKAPPPAAPKELFARSTVLRRP
ncbi:MAG: hypothetical protein ABMA64_26570 [Myxococcota bacterium]